MGPEPEAVPAGAVADRVGGEFAQLQVALAIAPVVAVQNQWRRARDG